ncbi:hypothetical protein FF38_12680 [Lucilia cuprina]|uniref:Uncharacterized protein n=1 Tax=Lucilia cuprina TaxID=7375 RepID=A0A0L0C415_LUCCU|nr:hypothetical protein FF38_12680 [Lucilia cuprina]
MKIEIIPGYFFLGKFILIRDIDALILNHTVINSQVTFIRFVIQIFKIYPKETKEKSIVISDMIAGYFFLGKFILIRDIDALILNHTVINSQVTFIRFVIQIFKIYPKETKEKSIVISDMIGIFGAA